MSISIPEIPFKTGIIKTDGLDMHYIDEGSGPILLMVHGLPEWGMVYAPLIKKLSEHYRCILPDHIGFGMSEKTKSVLLTPEAHAKRLLQFIEAKGLKNIHLLVHDFGGPIGLGALTMQPHLFSSITISNTWLWDLRHTKTGRILKNMQGVSGKWLYLNYGFSVKFMAKNGFADKSQFPRDIFMYPHQTKTDRYASYQLMLEMYNSGNYFNNTLERLKKIEIPVQLVWGMKDKFLTAENFLSRWQQELPKVSVDKLANAGHFPQYEAPQEMAKCIEQFIKVSV